MIRVLIAEDETITATALATLINKNEEPFEVVGIVENGEKALEALKKEKIDVLFTDIRMPIMDGMELLERIKEEKIEVFTVILSGYEEFEYARKALRYQVIEYLLKPLSKTGLSSVLKKIRTMYEKKSRETIENRLRNRGTEGVLSGNCYMALMNLGGLASTPDDILLPGAGSQYQQILESELQQWDRNQEMAWLIQGSTSVEKILITEGSGDEFNGNEKIQKYYDGIIKKLELPVTMVTHSNGIDINSVNTMYKKMKTVLYKKLIFAKSKMFHLEETEIVTEDKMTGAWISELCKCIVEKNGNMFKENLKKYLDYCEKINITQNRLFYQIQILMEYYKESYSGDSDVINMDFEPVCCTYVELYEELADIFYILINEKTDNGQENHLGAELKKYLEEHYTENLTIENLSKEFGFVPSYLARIFKKEYGITIGNYILERRMEVAKRLLKTNGRVKDVALQVGYADPYYFSKVFKKNIGCWPRDYK